MNSATGVCRWILVLWGGVLLTGSAWATNPPRSLDRYLPNDAFGVGERLDFSIGYGLIDAGTATMEVLDVVDVHGRPVYQIKTTATSNRFFDSFYKVRDTMLSLVDVEGLFTWRYEKHQHEGDYRRNQVVVFEQDRGLAWDGKDTVDIPQYVQDVLSAFYYVRAQDLQVGDTLVLPSMADRKTYELEVIVHGREEIRTPAGTFECLKVEPLLQAAGLFRHEGKITVWLTDDRLHMPVLMRSRVVIGSIHAELTAYRFGDLWEE
jgi:hypothetical protein